jgi:xanthine/uracil permease
VTEGPAKIRGWVSLYVVAFVLLVGAGAALVASAVGFLASTRLLWVSTGLSAAAIAAALLGVLLPRR